MVIEPYRSVPGEPYSTSTRLRHVVAQLATEACTRPAALPAPAPDGDAAALYVSSTAG